MNTWNTHRPLCYHAQSHPMVFNALLTNNSLTNAIPTVAIVPLSKKAAFSPHFPQRDTCPFTGPSFVFLCERWLLFTGTERRRWWCYGHADDVVQTGLGRPGETTVVNQSRQSARIKWRSVLFSLFLFVTRPPRLWRSPPVFDVFAEAFAALRCQVIERRYCKQVSEGHALYIFDESAAFLLVCGGGGNLLYFEIIFIRSNAATSGLGVG